MARKNTMIHSTISRRDFLISAGIAVSISAVGASGAFGLSADKSNASFLLSERGCGRATGYAETNKIITWDGKTHVAWCDSEENKFFVRVRTLDRATGVWSPTQTVGEAYDNHGGPALAVDSGGYLHIVYYPHHHPFRYRRSTRPNDASAWGKEERFGSKSTYPTLVVTPDDRLLVTCRESNQKGKPWVVNLYEKPASGGVWSAPRAIMQASAKDYSHFQEALAWDASGVLHLATRLYGGNPRRAYQVGYMRSPDAGKSWENARGEKLKLPATARTLSVVALAAPDSDSGAALRCGAIAVGPDGRPRVLYSINTARGSEPWIATPNDKGDWEKIDLLDPLRRALPGWSAGVPGGLGFDAAGRLHVLLTGLPPLADGSPASLAWGEPESEIVRMISSDGGSSFSVEIASPVDARRANWLPNIERPTGHNRVERPSFLYTGGDKGENNLQVVANRVYWVDGR